MTRRKSAQHGAETRKANELYADVLMLLHRHGEISVLQLGVVLNARLRQLRHALSRAVRSGAAEHHAYGRYRVIRTADAADLDYSNSLMGEAIAFLWKARTACCLCELRIATAAEREDIAIALIPALERGHVHLVRPGVYRSAKVVR